MAISVLNTDAGLSGKTIVNLEDNQTVTGLKTYDRDPNPPFAVSANSAVVPNLDADKLDGHEATAFAQIDGTSNAGNLLFVDATYDIGASGATRPRDLFLSRNATIGNRLNIVEHILGANGTNLIFGSRGAIGASADGVFFVTDTAGTSFGRLTFGGTTSSYPALKRSSANLHVRTADDSAYSGFSAGAIVNHGGLYQTKTTSPAQITSDQNNYDPTGIGNMDGYYRFGLNTDASRTLTGLLAGALDGQEIIILNNGSQNIVFANQSASSDAANRFLCPGAANFTLHTLDAIRLHYVTGSGWWLMAF